jgi:hypothetical protein
VPDCFSPKGSRKERETLWLVAMVVVVTLFVPPGSGGRK